MMLRVLLALVLGAGCGSGVAPEMAPANPVTESAPAEPEAASAIAAMVETGLLPAVIVRGEDARMRLVDRMRHHRVPAVSIAVIENHQLVWVGAYGVADASTGAPATPRTLMQAASISKPVNAMAVLMAAEAGKVSLDAPVNDLLSSWKLPDNEHTGEQAVTLRHLLSHTAGTTVHGFPGYAAGAALPTTAQVLDGEAPANTSAVRVDIPPGTRFRYSGGGTTISQNVLVDRLGAPYPGILASTVLGPLGMTDSTYEQPLPGSRRAQAAAAHLGNGEAIEGKHHVYPEMAAAGLWTTPTDLAKFFLALARARVGKPSPVSEAIARAMTTPVAPSGEPGSNVSLGTFVYERNSAPLFGHGGANHGFRSIARFSLDAGYGLVMMANSDNGIALMVEIERALMARPGWPGNGPAIERASVAPAELAGIAGRYAIDSTRPFTVAVSGSGAQVARPFRDPVELIPVGNGRYIARDNGRSLAFDVAAGTVTLGPPAGVDGSTVEAGRLGDDATLPVLELAAGRFDTAVASWRAIEAATPKSGAIDEPLFNRLGYRSLQAGDIATAIEILRFVTVVRPESSNAFDSLGEAYAAAGKRDLAIAAYRTSLAKLADDPAIAPAQKPARRKYGEAQLQKLGATP